MSTFPAPNVITERRVAFIKDVNRRCVEEIRLKMLTCTDKQLHTNVDISIPSNIYDEVIGKIISDLEASGWGVVVTCGGRGSDEIAAHLHIYPEKDK